MIRNCFLSCVVFLGVAVSTVSAAPRPNILIILTDDMGFSDLGCYGGEIDTPNLDQLAADGLRFTQFYNTARCCPTRASLLTGLYSHQAGVGHMTADNKLEGYQGELNQRCQTIAEVLRPAGYSAYMCGKWHVVRNLKADGPKYNWPLQRGFERFYGMVQGGGNYFDPATLMRGNDFVTPVNDAEYQPAPGQPYYFTDAIADNAVKFIADHKQKQAEQPFFLYVAFTAAHWPMHAKQADIDKYRGKYDAGYAPVRAARYERLKKQGIIKPGWKLTDQDSDWDRVKNKAWESRCMEVYAAMVDCMDQGVGRIVAQLRRDGLLDNTLVLYLQDNGGCAETIGRQTPKDGIIPQRPDKPTLPPIDKDTPQPALVPKQTRDGYPLRQGEGVMPGPADTYIAYGQGWANVSNTPFRLYKHWEHEGGIATPLIAHWPRGISRNGQLEHQPGHLIDIMATCVELAGAHYPVEKAGAKIIPLEGRSLSPAFAGRSIDREAIYWEHEGNRAIRMGKWKLVAKGPAGPWELYDMDADRSETNDLATANPQQVRLMVEKWEAWAKRANVLPWIWKPPYGQPAAAATNPSRKLFVLKSGETLTGDEAPAVRGKDFTLTAKIEQWGDGVIVAQGGTAHGYSLYVQQGRLHFVARINNALHTLTTQDKVRGNELIVTLARDGTATLAMDGKELARGKFPQTLAKTPVDGLSIGADSNAPVGDYEAPFEFKGKLREVKVEIRD